MSPWLGARQRETWLVWRAIISRSGSRAWGVSPELVCVPVHSLKSHLDRSSFGFFFLVLRLSYQALYELATLFPTELCPVPWCCRSSLALFAVLESSTCLTQNGSLSLQGLTQEDEHCTRTPTHLSTEGYIYSQRTGSSLQEVESSPGDN